MPKPNKSLISVVFMLLWVAVGGAQAGTDSVSTCEYTSFESYFRRFADDVVLQQNNTASEVSVTTLHREGEDLRPLTKQVSQDALKFPIVPDSKTRKSQNIDIIIYDNMRAIVMDKLGQYFRTYSFSGESCETLAAVENWMVERDVLMVNHEPGLSEKGNFCLKRGEYLSALASPEEHWSLVQMFEAALQNYLCAADEGSAQGALSAISLAESGMAPALDAKRQEKLLFFAAESEPRAMALLSTYYCTEGRPDSNDMCKNPVLAEKMLIKAIKSGEADLLNTLGVAFERGTMATHDEQRALACYIDAIAAGEDVAERNAKRLTAKGVVVDRTVKCLE